MKVSPLSAPLSDASEFFKARLESGITLVAERYSYARSVSIGVWVRTGSCFEEARINGISHFIEHMVFKGTERRNPLEIATVLECLGGDLNAFTEREYTCFHALVLKEHTEIALDVLSDLILRPIFPKLELERERKVLMQEMSMIEEAPEDWIGDVFFQTVWKDEPLGRPVIGTRKTLRTMSRNQIVDYYQEHYRPENIVISVAGNIDFSWLQEQCEKYFQFPTKQETLPLSQTGSSFRSRRKVVHANTEQLHLLLGFEGMGFKDPFRFDALILSYFLGGGMSSRLFQEIREKQGLAYSVECDCVPFSNTGLFSIYLATAPKSFKACLETIAREIERLKREKLSESDLALVKGQLRGAILMSSEQMEVRQESLGRNELIFGRYVPVDEVLTEIDRVSPERVFDLADKLFVKERQGLVVLSKTKPKLKDLNVL